ncbi:hypothetical protein [Pseudooceanicola nanhaiensis]|uniref:hypothetical protein n=1 Tax=Pseudooceanicola nanhaiensis TaxID=375761 RepID=UPI001CD6B4B0|nr:hypothetical protein [Pseudooceanicola nanhaiensis]MCA0922323.1 hypothetical protein [Pseudooceanicola nanhaiensis]
MSIPRRRALIREAANLRDALRLHTAEVHETLDARLSALDLGTADGRHCFSRIQLRGYLRLAASCQGEAAEATDQLRLVIAALREDLGQDACTDDLPSLCPALCPDAVAYVTLGSQLGLAMLRRSVPDDDRAGLFALTPDTAAWRSFCERMRLAAPTGPVADSILDDAIGAFLIFDEATRVELSHSHEKIQRPLP